MANVVIEALELMNLEKLAVKVRHPILAGLMKTKVLDPIYTT